MSLFYVSEQALKDALEASVEYLTEGKLRLFPYTQIVPTPDALGLWLVEWTSAYELRKLTVKWTRTPATGVVQDAAMCTFHFVNLTGGIPDESWITADYTAVEGAFDTFWTAEKMVFPTSLKLAEYQWRADGPAYRPFGSSLSPTLRTIARSVAATGVGEGLPPQVAVSVTETTDSKFTVENVEGAGTQLRNRWGRFYLPAPVVSQVGNGRFGSGTASALADAVETFYETCVTAGLHPVVYSPTTGHAWSVKEIHVDDIFDVIRSRRYVEPLVRNARVITQPA